MEQQTYLTGANRAVFRLKTTKRKVSLCMRRGYYFALLPPANIKRKYRDIDILKTYDILVSGIKKYQNIYIKEQNNGHCLWYLQQAGSE